MIEYIKIIIMVSCADFFGNGEWRKSMKKIISLLLAAIMVFGAMLSLSSCGAPKDSGAQISVYLGGEVFDFDPTEYNVSKNAEQILSLIYEPLFSLNAKGELGLAAAKDYSVDTKEREIKIKLRESYWSDEIRVTANDFIVAWRDIILAPGNPNPAAALFYDIENAIAIKAGNKSAFSFGAVATDDYEITITYREGADYKQLLKNLASVATAPVRIDMVETAPSYWSKDITKLVTNGPFKVATLDYDLGEFTLARNVGYHQKSNVEDYTKKVTPASLVSFFTAGKKLELTYDDIQSKTVFFMSEATLADRMDNKNNAKVADDFSTYTYVFNTNNPLFKDAKVRKALSLALDREAIIEAVTFGKAANGFLPDVVAKSIYGKSISNRIVTSDGIEEAKELLKTVDFAGLSKSFTLKINNDEQSVAIAEIAKAAWKQLGFTVTVQKLSSVTNEVVDKNAEETIEIKDSAIQTLVKKAALGVYEFDVIAVDWQMYSSDALVALSAFTSHMNGNGVDFVVTGKNRTNISGWTNAEFDSYINAAYIAKNSNERKEALANAEKLLLEEAPIIPIMYNQSFSFVSGDLSGVKFDGFGNFVFTKVSQKNYEKYLPKED